MRSLLERITGGGSISGILFTWLTAAASPDAPELAERCGRQFDHPGSSIIMPGLAFRSPTPYRDRDLGVTSGGIDIARRVGAFGSPRR